MILRRGWRVKCALYVPNTDEFGDARVLADLAREAETSRWDGFFIYDTISPASEPSAYTPLADPWIALTAIAMCTERIRLGPMATPVARRRPWKLAREAVTLDRLSGGRLILGVGLGGDGEAEFERFGEDAHARTRSAKLDEGLAILAGLWTGAPFSYDGAHFRGTT